MIAEMVEGMMIRSYELRFKAGLALLAGASVAAFCVSRPLGIGVTAGAFLVFVLSSLRYVWWLPRVSRHLPLFLMLHSVSDAVVEAKCPNNSLRPKELETLIGNLLAAGYTFQTASEAIRNPVNRSVVLTFDDGYVDNYTNLFPILKRFQVPATLFITDRGDTDSDNFLTREQVREMQASGLVEFGGHTAHHMVLDALPLDAAEREIRENQQWLSDVLGKAPACFAYPCGGYNEAIIRAVEAAGYSYAFTMHKKMRPVAGDPYRIHRQIIPRGKRPLEAYLIATRGKCRF